MACCPRVRVVCKRPKATTVSTSYYTLKDPVLAPKKHTAHAVIHKDAVCSVKLGSETLLSGVKLGDARIDKAISRAQDKRAAAGCSAEAPVIPAVKNTPSTKYPDAPSEVIDVLRAKAKRVKK